MAAIIISTDMVKLILEKELVRLVFAIVPNLCSCLETVHQLLIPESTINRYLSHFYSQFKYPSCRKVKQTVTELASQTCLAMID
jgi:hypothetical protein